MYFFLSSRWCPSQFCLSRSLFIRQENSRAPASFSLFYLYSVVERRMKEEYARKIQNTRREGGGVRFCFCFLKFPSLNFSIDFCPRWCAKNLNFSHVLKRERSPLLKDKTQHASIYFPRQFCTQKLSRKNLVTNSLPPPSPHKIKGKRHASSQQ